jgi:hypothetical protein
MRPPAIHAGQWVHTAPYGHAGAIAWKQEVLDEENEKEPQGNGAEPTVPLGANGGDSLPMEAKL